MQMIFIRHGQTEGNQAGRYIGSTDEPLSSAGQEELLRRRNSGIYPPVPLVFTSPMLRCRQSAACIYPQVQAQIVTQLRECHFGRFEGLTYQQLKDREDYRAWLEGGPCPEGEDRGTFIHRCADAFLILARRLEKQGVQRVGLVLHGGVIMAIFDRFAQPAHAFYHWQLPCGAGYMANWEQGTLRQIHRLEDAT